MRGQLHRWRRREWREADPVEFSRDPKIVWDALGGMPAWVAVISLGIGIILGPTGLGYLRPPLFPGAWRGESLSWPHAVIAGMAELGLIQVFFLSGVRRGRDGILTQSANRGERHRTGVWSVLLCRAAIRFALSAGSFLVIMSLLGAGGASACAIAGVLSTASLALSPSGTVWAEKAVVGPREISREKRALDSGSRGRVLLSADLAPILAVLGALLVLIAVGWERAPSSGAHRAVAGVGLYILKTALLVGITDRILAWYVMGAERRARTGREVRKEMYSLGRITLRHQAFIGFLALFAIFYGWAAWRIGPLAAMGVAYVGGRQFGRSPFGGEFSEGAASWLIRISIGAFFLTVGAALDVRALGQEVGMFFALLGAGGIGRFLSALAGAQWVPANQPSHALGDLWDRLIARSRRVLDEPLGGEVGWVLAGFAFSRGVIPPELMTLVLGLISSTTLGVLLLHEGKVPMRRPKACGDAAPNLGKGEETL